MSQALDAATYDHHWDHRWSDFIRYHPGARHRRRLILECLARAPRFERVLDVGCGLGQLLELIDERFPGRDLTGVDLSQQAVETNRARWPGRRFEVLDLAQGALSETFDLVVCSEVIEHLEDQAGALERLASMVAPGGTLLLTCPTGKLHETERHMGHVHHPTLDELRALADPHGLEFVSATNWGWPLYRALKWATNLDAERAMKHFAQGSYGFAQKLVSRLLYRTLFLDGEHSARGVQLIATWRKSS